MNMTQKKNRRVVYALVEWMCGHVDGLGVMIDDLRQTAWLLKSLSLYTSKQPPRPTVSESETYGVLHW